MRTFLGILILLFSSTVATAHHSGSSGGDPFRVVIMVNKTPITAFEIDARTELLRDTTAITDGETLRAQAIDALIDEALQLQEAERLDVLPDRSIGDERFAKLAENNDLSVREFENALSAQGINPGAFRSRLRPQVAWNNVVAIIGGADVRVEDEEIEERFAEIQASKHLTERLITEVYLRGGTRAQALNVASKMRSSGNFAEFARATSNSPTASTNGDLGWVWDGELDGTSDAAIRGLNRGDVSAPVARDGGYYIYGVRSVRPVGAKSTTDLYDVRELFIELEAGGQSENDRQKLLALQNVIKRIDTCARFSQAANIYGDPGTRNYGYVNLRDLDPLVGGVANSLSIGEMSALVPRPGGASLIMKCGKTTTSEPMTEDDVRGQLQGDKIRDVSADHMRTLRRRAYIDYR